ncbi:helix-hairpin-helix domain-containing protein [Luteibacter aegosomatis]|uniref:ComEA family DNA-binding protein n=1 Tax=Luteibacter aegosomatis TaxID=2911537 RepID=UPI001FF88FF1|nr:helix-hairpin-helix domain-containing protein [Luteibacter aegosomatis]UPG87293.1 helix-hairpin-helix domain-containing protein [Luteibacter aegosomatis]
MNRYLSTLTAMLLASPAFASTPVNVNTADASTLAQSLDGVGLAKAKAIVAWRDANGAFESADQLTDVKGIGPSLIDRNRDAILLADGKPAKKKAKTASKPRATESDE